MISTRWCCKMYKKYKTDIIEQIENLMIIKKKINRYVDITQKSNQKIIKIDISTLMR